MFRKHRSSVTLGLAAVWALLAGCSNNDDNPMAPNIGPAAGQAYVQVIHASPNAPDVDVLVDGTKALTAVPFLANSNYLAAAEGTRNVKVNVTGTATTVIDANLGLAANTSYSVFAVDSVSKISAVVLTDDLAPPAAGQAKVRFVHLSPNAPAVDVAVTGGSVLFANRAFKQFTPFSGLPAGTYDLEVRLAGQATVVLSIPGVTIEAGKIYTVWASGFVGGSGDEALGAQIIQNNSAQVMVVHASPDAPGVDLLWDDAMAGMNLVFPNNTGYLDVTTGDHNAKVNVTGTSTTVIDADLTLEPGAVYSVFAVDSVSKIAPLVVADDLTAPAAGMAHVRFIHLSPNAPAVDVAVMGGPTLFANRSFKDAADFVPVMAGSYDLEVRLAGQSTVVLSVNGVNLQDGRIYTVFARGFVGGAGGEALGAEIIENN